MSFFGMDFEKEGKGVREDGVREKALPRFFGIVQRKFWTMMRLNLMQVAGSLPAMALCIFFFSRIIGDISTKDIVSDLSLRLFSGFILISLQLVTVGPLQAGFIYTMRNFAREEHVFIGHHFMTGIRENWKRALCVSLIDLIAVFFLAVAFRFYSRMSAALGPIAEGALAAVVVLAVIYAIMHLYIYPMMVTLDLTVRQLYANAVRFAFGKLLPNLGILLLMLALSLLMFINILVGIVVMLLIGYAFLNLLSTFYAYYGIEEYILKKVPAGQHSVKETNL